MTTPPPTQAHEALAAETFRRSRGRWRWIAFAVAVLAVLAVWGRFAVPGSTGGEVVARVTLNGTITTNAARQQLLEDLIEDDRVKAVVVAINSPGGTTAGGEELYEVLRRLSAEKPTVAVIHELGASAAYMTAIGTDRIFARRLSIVGSIGVLYQHINAGKLLDTIGIDFDKIASGPLKAEPDINEPLVGAPRESLGQLVEDSFAWFVDIVAERRGMSRPEALALADGRIVAGQTGLDLGLIDAIGGEHEARLWLEAEHSVSPDLAALDVWPRPDNSFSLIGQLIGGATRSALGLPTEGPVMLDGLVSLWQVEHHP
ncbi:signal peptide peptidase SppA [Devosia crocina]|uniref:signal peptide peptidase SppA n=1 Tax=Devosia crocina TaxID=429728 RepID=UPI0015877089|nr:signal peptide peptidase SppA [Devosia crocina]